MSEFDKIKVLKVNEDDGVIKFFCPGCFKKHELDMPPYDFTGTLNKPTLNQPVLIMDKRGRIQCGATIEDGIIEFSTASLHFMAGQKEELPDYDV